MFTTPIFWLGFLAGTAFIFLLAFLYGNYVNRKDTHCLSCYSDVKNERYMTWVEFPGKGSRLIKCSDKWHDK